MSRRRRNVSVPRPFLKWVGGKGQLLDPLLRLVERAGEFGRYHEPFAGGAALFFELYRIGGLGRKHAYLSDTNERLIDAFLAVQQNVDRVINRLKAHRALHSKDHYYAVRGEVPDGLIERGARIIYLNRTCYNGLFRENSKGLFNVPFGRYENPLICDEENLRAASMALTHAKVEVRPFGSVLEEVERGDLVYFDPPYDPLSRTASFTAYEKTGFGRDKQQELAAVAKALTDMGVKVILSNSMTPFICKLYADHFMIDEVLARRHVNSRADRRGAVSEVLIRNF
ncbi:MAG: DNA adenine methylase [Candidatus Hydrogenedentes bacterium]|nr:DNA adenine methylase [Candidatus Hydrogenedentota bacterium]